MNGNGGHVAATAVLESVAAKRTESVSSMRQGDDNIGLRHVPATDIHVVAHAVQVTAGSGATRWAATFRCFHCGCRHLSHIRGDLPLTVRRAAACKGGTLVLHLVERV